MVKKSRTESKIDDDIKSAGQSFLGIRMSDLLMRIPEQIVRAWSDIFR